MNPEGLLELVFPFGPSREEKKKLSGTARLLRTQVRAAGGVPVLQEDCGGRGTSMGMRAAKTRSLKIGPSNFPRLPGGVGFLFGYLRLDIKFLKPPVI